MLVESFQVKVGYLVGVKRVKIQKFNGSCMLSKAARMSSAYLKQNLGLLRLYSFSNLGL